jgi:hypothetical protein
VEEKMGNRETNWHDQVMKSILSGERVVIGGIKCGRTSFAKELVAMGFVMMSVLDHKDIIVSDDRVLRRFYEVRK